MLAAGHRSSRYCPCPGRTRSVPGHDCVRQFIDGGLRHARGGPPRPDGKSFCDIPAREGPPAANGRHALRRRAADGRDRARPDGRSEITDVGRAFTRPRPADGRRGVQGDQGDQRLGRHGVAGRAKHSACACSRQSGVCAGSRPRGLIRERSGIAHERKCAQGLPGPLTVSVSWTKAVSRLLRAYARAKLTGARGCQESTPMFVSFFQELKNAGLPVTLREYLTLMEAMEADLASRRVDDFYFLSRAALVKDERNLDKFDRVFGHVFKGLETLDDVVEADIPAEWLKKLAEKYLTDEEKKQIEAMGGLDKLLETLRKRLAEQKRRHQGGSKWIGTAGTSPYGAYGYNPEGVRIGQDANRNFRAVKVWDKREFKDLDDEVELGTRNIKLALRRLRKFARTGAPEELDLDGTIKGTAHKGYLDILMRPERHNAVNVLLFFDIGGSMD